jgi:hypothetical protein
VSHRPHRAREARGRINARAQIIANLGEHYFGKKALGKDLVQLASDVDKFEKVRNDYLHGLWVYYPKDSKDIALLRRKSLQQKIDPHPDTDAPKLLAQHLKKLKAIQNEAQRLTRAIKALRGSF